MKRDSRKQQVSLITAALVLGSGGASKTGGGELWGIYGADPHRPHAALRALIKSEAREGRGEEVGLSVGHPGLDWTQIGALGIPMRSGQPGPLPLGRLGLGGGGSLSQLPSPPRLPSRFIPRTAAAPSSSDSRPLRAKPGVRVCKAAIEGGARQIALPWDSQKGHNKGRGGRPLFAAFVRRECSATCKQFLSQLPGAGFLKNLKEEEITLPRS